MSRVNVDRPALSDPRFLRLGLLLGCPREFALDAGRGRMEHVWSYCTEHNRSTLEAWELEAILGDGAAAHVVAARLGAETPEGVYIAGTKGRIEWLSNKRKAMKRASGPHPVIVTTKPLDNEPTTDIHCRADNKEQEQEQEKESSLSLEKSKPRAEAEAWAEWFARKSGRRFSATGQLVDQVKALVRSGHTQRQMRAVALYCIREWQGDPKMAKHLVPSTLLRTGKFQERLDLARLAGIYHGEAATEPINSADPGGAT